MLPMNHWNLEVENHGFSPNKHPHFFLLGGREHNQIQNPTLMKSFMTLTLTAKGKNGPK